MGKTNLEGSPGWIAVTGFLPLGFLLAGLMGGQQESGRKEGHCVCKGVPLTPHARSLPEAHSPVLMATVWLRQPSFGNGFLVGP